MKRIKEWALWSPRHAIAAAVALAVVFIIAAAAVSSWASAFSDKVEARKADARLETEAEPTPTMTTFPAPSITLPELSTPTIPTAAPSPSLTLPAAPTSTAAAPTTQAPAAATLPEPRGVAADVVTKWLRSKSSEDRSAWITFPVSAAVRADLENGDPLLIPEAMVVSTGPAVEVTAEPKVVLVAVSVSNGEAYEVQLTGNGGAWTVTAFGPL